MYRWNLKLKLKLSVEVKAKVEVENLISQFSSGQRIKLQFTLAMGIHFSEQQQQQQE